MPSLKELNQGQNQWKKQLKISHFCVRNLDTGQCVQNCPFEARIFGDLDDSTSEISHIKEKRNVRILREEKGTNPQVFYFN